MSTISDDIAALITATSAITTDVATVLIDLATANNITPSQKTTLETQITALQALDVSLKTAIKSPMFHITPVFMSID